MTHYQPLARQEGLLVQKLENETIVYDNATDRAYVLNPISTAVWNACNGKRTVPELTRTVNQQMPASENVVWYALKQLQPLLQESAPLPQEYVRMTRRQFLVKTGIVAAAVSIPVVTILAVPAPAAAQSAIFWCNCGTFFRCNVTSCNDCNCGGPPVSCDSGNCPT